MTDIIHHISDVEEEVFDQMPDYDFHNQEDGNITIQNNQGEPSREDSRKFEDATSPPREEKHTRPAPSNEESSTAAKDQEGEEEAEWNNETMATDPVQMELFKGQIIQETLFALSSGLVQAETNRRWGLIKNSVRNMPRNLRKKFGKDRLFAVMTMIAPFLARDRNQPTNPYIIKLWRAAFRKAMFYNNTVRLEERDIPPRLPKNGGDMHIISIYMQRNRDTVAKYMVEEEKGLHV